MARQLRKRGFEAAALAGGYDAWRASFPIEPIGRPGATPAFHDLHAIPLVPPKGDAPEPGRAGPV